VCAGSDPDDHLNINAIKVASSPMSSVGAFPDPMIKWGRLRGASLQATCICHVLKNSMSRLI